MCLKSLLSSPPCPPSDGLAAFRTFLKTEFSDENIEFWMACEDYKKIKSSTKLVSKANKIFKEFIDVQAPREVEDRNLFLKNMRNFHEPRQEQSAVHLPFLRLSICCLCPRRSTSTTAPGSGPSRAWRTRRRPASMRSRLRSTVSWRKTPTHGSSGPRCTRT